METVCGRRLIVTADDFGASSEVNDAVVKGSREGILRFASLMVAEPAAQEAVRRAKQECPQLSLGLHVVLCAGRSVLGPSAIPGLVDSTGRFPDDPVMCGVRYFFNGNLRSALEKEMRAQFKRFLELGLAPSHVDGHANIHVHPVIFPILVRLCREFGFSRLRLPGGEFSLSMRFSVRPFWKQIREAFIFSVLRTYLLKAHAHPEVVVPDRTLGLLRSGVMREDYVSHCMARLPAGISEIYFHPSTDLIGSSSVRPNPTHRNQGDLQALLSKEVRETMQSSGVELVGDG